MVENKRLDDGCVVQRDLRYLVALPRHQRMRRQSDCTIGVVAPMQLPPIPILETEQLILWPLEERDASARKRQHRLNDCSWHFARLFARQMLSLSGHGFKMLRSIRLERLTSAPLFSEVHKSGGKQHVRTSETQP